MAKKVSLIGNKVAQRILVSFVLAALMPIGIFGVLSYQQVNTQFRDQTTKSLHRSCEDYALGLLGRLTLADSSLRLLATKIEKYGKNSQYLSLKQESRIEQPFSGLVVIPESGEKTPAIDHTPPVPELTKQDIAEIHAGKSLIKATADKIPASHRLWMIIGLVKHSPTEKNQAAGILMAELNSELLWEKDNETNTFWVLDGTGRMLFESEPGFSFPAAVKANFTQADSGVFNWTHESKAYIGAYWKLLLKGMFSGSELVIVESQPETLAFAAIQQFTAIFPPVILLAMLLVAYFSTRFVAKYLSPLEQLKAATLKIGEGDFSSHINIDSHDEFEELAGSFNEMTRRLRSQFDILSTMAEIDRHILSSLNAEDIVETALNRLPAILFCDLISIARIDPETYCVSDIHTRRSGEETVSITEAVKLNLQDTLDLLAMQNDVIETGNDGRFSAYLYSIGGFGDWCYLIVPIVVNGTLSSIICLGYEASSKILAESRSAARNFGDRIAVALSNAAWEEKLYHQAHFDTLTGLPNRLVLNDRLGQEIARAKRDNTQLAVFFIDLDRFKSINDSLGHSAGDELLTQVAEIFLHCVRATDLVVRSGGDEFVIVISDLHGNHNPMSLVRSIAEKILRSVSQPLTIAGHPMTFTASVGIAIFPNDASSIQDLLKNADAAMYHAKNEGRANFRFYSHELNAATLENIKLEQGLRNAIAKGELSVYYQPKVNLLGEIVGAEALVRWRHAKLGMVSPAKFIPLAEQSGLIVEIGEWVFEQTCLLIKSCQSRVLGGFRVSVNLSAIEFKRPDLVAKVAMILAKTGVDRSLLEFELTETVAIGNAKICIERMKELKNLGLTLAMDDFGTGFSSLSYLRELPLDVLKIDQAFIRHIETEESSKAIVKAIIALANGLGMTIVAEGVETEGQLAFLKQHTCSIFQGYLFSPPVPAEDFAKMLVADPFKTNKN